MVEAIANELSPARVKGTFPGKNGMTKLVHMLYYVAKDVKNAPVVIYIDQCDQFFVGGGKKAKNADKDGPSRFKKDLLTYKQQAFTKDDRVIIIGTSSSPEKGDIKDMKNFFDKFLYMPYPDYPSRLMLWRKFIKDQLALAGTSLTILTYRRLRTSPRGSRRARSARRSRRRSRNGELNVLKSDRTTRRSSSTR